jgi:hypothetical protein
MDNDLEAGEAKVPKPKGKMQRLQKQDTGLIFIPAMPERWQFDSDEAYYRKVTERKKSIIQLDANGVIGEASTSVAPIVTDANGVIIGATEVEGGGGVTLLQRLQKQATVATSSARRLLVSRKTTTPDS